MMKKLLFSCLAIWAFHSASNAQVITIDDTLKYFDNKQLYILPTNTLHPTTKTKAAVVTNTAITHLGSVFRSSSTVTVSGLEARVLRVAPSVTGAPFGPPLRLYLCNVSNGVPVFPPLDSISSAVYNTAAIQYGQYAGGNFAVPKVVTGDFAVVFRNVSTYDGDTIAVLRTAAYTRTATNAPSPQNKFGEGLGVVRNSGTWIKTTDFVHPYFGLGTDYEFCLSPVVHFTLEASQIESPVQAGACCWQVFTNTTTSSPLFSNQQFNLNEFFRVWKPGNRPSGVTTDSVFVWDLGDGSPTYTSPHGTNTVNLSFVSGHCNQFYTGLFTANYKRQASLSGPSYASNVTFTSSTVYCGGDTAGTGIYEIVSLANLKIYPNPTSDKVTISGLTGKNSVVVFDMLGQLVSSQITDKELYVVDLLKQPRGNYVIRITNAENKTRDVKILKE